MKQRPARWLLLTALTLAAIVAWGARARDRGDLPPEIAVWVERLFPDAEIVDVEVEMGKDGGDDAREYEVRLKRVATDHAIELEASPFVGVTEYEEDQRVEDLPPRVRQTLQKTFPDARIEAVRKHSEVRVEYKIGIELESGGRRREVRLSPKGRILEIEKRD